jgi:hypothetical protein
MQQSVQIYLLCQWANAAGSDCCNAVTACLEVTGSGAGGMDGTYHQSLVPNYYESDTDVYRTIADTGAGFNMYDGANYRYGMASGIFPCGVWVSTFPFTDPIPTVCYIPCVPAACPVPAGPNLSFFVATGFTFITLTSVGGDVGGTFEIYDTATPPVLLASHTIPVSGIWQFKISTIFSPSFGLERGNGVNFCYYSQRQYLLVPIAPSAWIFDDGAGGFWQLIVDITGNVGTQSTVGPATMDIILDDGSGGFWKIVVDAAGDRGTVSDAGPATLAPVLFDGVAGYWELIVDSNGQLGSQSV